MRETDALTGTVCGVRDYGPLVILYLDAGDGRVLIIPLEQRPFRRLLEDQGCQAEQLVGRGVRCGGDSILFLD
jgi:hypothetical protein